MLSDRTVLITGGGGGLGEGIARVCHREGANVVVCDIKGHQAERVAGSLVDRALGLFCDVRNQSYLQFVASATLQRFASFDGLVNNVGSNCSARRILYRFLACPS